MDHTASTGFVCVQGETREEMDAEICSGGTIHVLYLKKPLLPMASG